MKRHLRIEINCGEKTCASKPGAFCRHMLTTRFGQENICGLFRYPSGEPIRLDDTNGDGSGWLLRCRECLESDDKSCPEP